MKLTDIKGYEKSLDALIAQVKAVKGRKGLDSLVCSLYKLHESLSDEEKYELSEALDLPAKCNTLLELCFENKVFRASLQEALKPQEETESVEVVGGGGGGSSHVELRNQEFLRVFVSLSGSLLSVFLPTYTPSEMNRFRQHFAAVINNLVVSLGDEFDSAKICFTLHMVVTKVSSPTIDFSVKVNPKVLYNQLSVSCALIGCLFLVLPQHHVMRLSFKKANSVPPERAKLLRQMSAIYGAVSKIEGGLESEKSFLLSLGYAEQVVDLYIENIRTNNEKVCGHLIREVSRDLYFQPEATDRPFVTFGEQVLHKINASREILADIHRQARRCLAAYDERNGIDRRNEWSNKVYLQTVSLLSVLDALAEALSDSWRIDAAVNRLFEWIRELHQILNKYDIEDDWSEIAALVVQENQEIEWKATFLTSIQKAFISPQAEKGMERDVMGSLAKAIIGMINAKGGSIIVGLVENPDEVMREDFFAHMIEKSGRTFLDVNYELKQKNLDIDQVKRRLQDVMTKETGMPLEVLDTYWSLEAINLRDREEMVTVYGIFVNRGTKPIYHFTDEGGRKSISLLKRIDARTIFVDPRDHSEPEVAVGANKELKVKEPEPPRLKVKDLKVKDRRRKSKDVKL